MMKKQLLLLFAASAGLTGFGQNQASKNLESVSRYDKYAFDNYNPSVYTFPKQAKNVNPIVTPQALSSFSIGTAGNIFTILDNRTYVWADPRINTVAFSHRYKVGTGTNAVGFLTADWSKSGGTIGTWTVNMGTLYDPAPTPSSAYGARYPQGIIYNPPGNTTADSAFFSYYAPTRDNSNPSGTGDWGGTAWGGTQLSGLLSPVQMDTGSNQSPSTLNYWFVIPDDMTITKDGITHVIERNAKGTGSSLYPYNDTMIYTVGKWDTVTNNFIYKRRHLRIPVSIDNQSNKQMADVKISFADDGLTGYISLIGHHDYALRADSTYYLIVYKTIDGGANWTGPTNINVDGVHPLFSVFSGNPNKRYTTAFEHDAVVDSLGNLHMIVGIGGQGEVSAGVPRGWSIQSAAGYWGLFDVYTTNGGTAWMAQLLDYPQFFRGIFGTPGSSGANPQVNSDTRVHASRSWDGNKILFSWFVSDSIQNFGLTHNNRNIYPDLFTKGLDIKTNMWSNTLNRTGGLTSALAGTIYFGSSSYYAFDVSSGYKLPVVYAQFSPTQQTDQDVQFMYLDSVIFDESGFNVASTAVALFSGGTGIQSSEAKSMTVSQNMPNPFTNATVINVSLASTEVLTLEVYNSIGQLVMAQSPKTLAAGNHQITIDGKLLDKGIYFYTVKTGKESVTKRMIVQ